MVTSKSMERAQTTMSYNMFAKWVSTYLSVLFIISWLLTMTSTAGTLGSEGSSNCSVYLFGDSTTERLYVDGLINVYNCTMRDPHAVRHTESIENYYEEDRGMVCQGKGVERIGYMFNWGVASNRDYARSWKKHRMFAGDPGSPYIDSPDAAENVRLAIKEFQNRTRFNENPVYFIYLSALWDGHRYHYQYKYRMNISQMLSEYQADYRIVVTSLLPLLRPHRDHLILQTAHKIKEWNRTVPLIALMNDRVKLIAKELKLPVFDVHALLGEQENKYLVDVHHQRRHASELIARNILQRNWTIPVDYVSTIRYIPPITNSTK